MLALLYCKKIIFHSAKIFFNPLKHKTLIISKQGKYDLVDFQNQVLICRLINSYASEGFIVYFPTKTNANTKKDIESFESIANNEYTRLWFSAGK